jgi:hypothetical protein
LDPLIFGLSPVPVDGWRRLLLAADVIAISGGCDCY